MQYDVIVVGGGPAGLNAALYAARAGLSCLVLEKMFAGGQMTKTTRLENYIGFADGVDAIELAMQMERQAAAAGAVIRNEAVTELRLCGQMKHVITAKADYTCRAVILAMGAVPRLLEVSGEQALTGRGVSYCATCDGALYKGKTVAVVGGGDTALEDALFLAKLCKKVYLIHRRSAFRGAKVLAERVAAAPNVELVLDAVVTAIEGTERVDRIALRHVKTAETDSLPVDGVFIAVGTKPMTELVTGQLRMDEGGYIVTDEHMQTSLSGVFAAGDLRKKPLRQVITAAADGAVAAFSALRYTDEK